ncbi:MAG TPA: DUF533 domain-containing protein [Polyangiaceae bacterium]|nr:DUF533 domain-containing protein [Polyangiaceae bacterium]
MAIVKSLVAIAWADGRVTSDETEVIDALLQAYNASSAEVDLVRDYASEPRGLEDIPLTELDAGDRRVLLQHAVLLTFVDGELHDKERALLDSLAERLHIDKGESDELVRVASERAKRLKHLL